MGSTLAAEHDASAVGHPLVGGIFPQQDSGCEADAPLSWGVGLQVQLTGGKGSRLHGADQQTATLWSAENSTQQTTRLTSCAWSRSRSLVSAKIYPAP